MRLHQAKLSNYASYVAVHLILIIGMIVAAKLCLAQDNTPEVSPELEIPEVAPTVEIPSEKFIQKAIMRCLSSIDKSLEAVRARGRSQGAAEDGETRYCIQSKQACSADPGGLNCRVFVRDYAENTD